jgi:homoserine dehydrogenase
MPSKLKMTGIRLTEEQNYKIRYIAEMNHRKINDEFKLMVENHIKQYEQNYGIIKIENQENATTPKNNIETLINSGNVIVGDNSTINM